MMRSFRASLKELWNRLAWPDLVSTAVAAGGLMAAIFGFNDGFFSFLKYLAVLAGVYLLFRFIGWWRKRLLWGLRKRLIVGYLFIAFFSLFFTGKLVLSARRLLVLQVGGHSFHEGLQHPHGNDSG